MKIKSIEKIDELTAHATLFGGVIAKVHMSDFRMGDSTHTPLSAEDPLIKMAITCEYIEDGVLTGEYEYIGNTITVRASEIPTTDLASDELKMWFVDKVVEMYTPVEVTDE